MYKYLQSHYDIIRSLIENIDSTYIQDVILRICDFEGQSVNVSVNSININLQMAKFLS